MPASNAGTTTAAPSVVVATQTTTTLPDGKRIENGNRWVATAIQEGDQWKISNLLQVI